MTRSPFHNPPTPHTPAPRATWSDAHLEALLRDAANAARLEAGDHHLHDTDGAPHAPPGVIATLKARAGSLALAAGLALASALALWTLLAPALAPTPIAAAPRPLPRLVALPAHATDRLESTATVLLAVAQDEHGTIECVRWTDRALAADANVATLTDDDLTRLGLDLSCAPAPRRVLVVGLSGPSGLLPCSLESAADLARCVIASQACGLHPFDATACTGAGQSCAQPGLNITVTALALR